MKFKKAPVQLQFLSIFKSKHQSLFRFSLIGIGFIFALYTIFIIVFSGFEHIAYDSLADINRDFAVQTEAITEILNSSMGDYTMQLFYSPSIRSLRSKNPISESDCKSMLRDVNSILEGATFLHSIVVHNGYTNTIYSSSGNIPVQALEDYDNAALQRLIVNKAEEPILTPIYCHSNDGEDYYAVLYYTQRESGSPAPSTLILTLKADWYQQKILSFSDYAADLIILNENSDVLMVVDKSLKQSYKKYYPMISITENSGYFVGEQNEICMYYRSPSTGYTYMRINNMEQLLPQLFLFKNILICIMGGLIFVFAGILIWLLAYTWRPMRKMQHAMNTIDRLLNTQQGNSEETAAPIDQQIETVIIKAERVHLESKFYDMLVDKVAPDASRLFKRDFSCFGLILLPAQHRSDVYCVTDELSSEFIVTKSDSSLICINNYASPEEYQNVIDLLSSELNKRLFVSSLFTQFSTLREHFHNLTELQKLNAVIPTETIVVTEDFLLKKSLVTTITPKDFTEFTTRLKAGNLETSQTKCHQLLESMKNCRYDAFRHTLLKINEVMQKVTNECELSDKINLKDFPDAPERIESFEEYEALLNRSILTICDYYSGQKVTKYSVLAEDIKKLIENQYHDRSLNSQKIADDLQMNNAYIGRIFRSSCGYSINDYINKCRIEESISLLSNTEMSIEEIALASGFANIKYFYVLFKKNMGITPAHYRSTNNSAL